MSSLNIILEIDLFDDDDDNRLLYFDVYYPLSSESFFIF